MGREPKLEILPRIGAISRSTLARVVASEWSKVDGHGMFKECPGVTCQLAALMEPLALFLPQGRQHHHRVVPASELQ